MVERGRRLVLSTATGLVASFDGLRQAAAAGRAVLRLRRAHRRAREDRHAAGVLERRPAGRAHRLVQQPLHLDPVRAVPARRSCARRVLRPSGAARARPRQGRPGPRDGRGRRRPRGLRAAGPDARRRARPLHGADRPHADAAAVGARQPAVAVVVHERGPGALDRARVPRTRDPVRRALPRHRLHGRLPRVHLGPRAVPGPRRPDRGAALARVPGRDDHRPRREGRRGVRPVRRGARARASSASRARATSSATSSGRGCARSRTSRIPAVREWWGSLALGAARRRRRGSVVRHERAGAVRAAAVDDARGRGASRRRAGAAARRGAQRVRVADGGGGAGAGCRGCGPTRGRS